MHILRNIYQFSLLEYVGLAEEVTKSLTHCQNAYSGYISKNILSKDWCPVGELTTGVKCTVFQQQYRNHLVCATFKKVFQSLDFCWG